MKNQPFTGWLLIVFMVQFLMENVRAYSEPVTQGSSSLFRSASVLVRNSESFGSSTQTLPITFASSFNSSPRVVYAIKRYAGKFIMNFKEKISFKVNSLDPLFPPNHQILNFH